MTNAFKQILIANRGEIAVRIARAAADLGIASLAVYSEDDDHSLHVAKADRAVPLTGSGATPYLDVEQLIAIALREGCDAIHPGYGFLSENAGFSRLCAEAGIVFIGASADLLERLGDKAMAREIAATSHLPMARGINRPCSLDDIKSFYKDLPQPATVMIKALAGGGGRGLRSVDQFVDLEDAYQQCRDEAKIAFGHDAVYIEEQITNARHIEVQILGDGSGAVAHAWERECTLQRRNQKLLEIAPSPSLSPEHRQSIIDAALKLASDVHYKGVGTFEFLVDASDHSQFYFMEINPRIQVEHTVTEEITGLDLVQAQILLAAGNPLETLELDDLKAPDGFAIQARINLESMAEDGVVLPTSGVISSYSMPSGRGIRVDDCAYVGYRVSPAFDSLAAKLIVRGRDYQRALHRLSRCLREVNIQGVPHNLDLLNNLVANAAVADNQVTTRFVEKALTGLLKKGTTRPLFFPSSASVASVEASVPTPDGCLAVTAITAGALVKLAVHTGDEILEGQTVAVLEAMKMEIPIVAPCDGTIVDVVTSTIGATLDEGQSIAFVRPGDVSLKRDDRAAAVDLETIRPDLHNVLDRHAQLTDAHRAAATAKRHSQGKRTARENVADLLDEGSFNEYGALVVAAQRRIHDEETLRQISPADGVIIGTGCVNSDLFNENTARCAVMSYDYTVMAGTQGIMNHKKTDRVLELVKTWQMPFVLFAEGGGGRPSDTDQSAVASLDLHTFSALGALSGLVPSVGIVAGNCFAGNAAMLGLMDVIIATPQASIGMAGPAMIEGGGLGVFSPAEVGPTDMQARNGVVDIVVANEAEAVSAAKQYLAYFQGKTDNWTHQDQRQLRHLIPENRMQIYDVRRVIEVLADDDSVLELRRDFARSAVTALIRIEGRPFGLFANDPHHLGGAIDADAGDKFARFMQLCDAHDLPMISLCDTPGFMVGPESEMQATVRHVARMFVHAANMTVPLFTIVLRKCYGLGAQAMAGGGLANPVLTASWPSGEFGAMGIEGAVRLSARKQLEAIEDPEARQALFQQLVDELYAQGNAMNAASFMELDAVIDPFETRAWLVRAAASAPTPSARSGKKRPCIDTW